ncbi:putative mfs transporter [Diaporthe ampelina]|uniref:Putative mfs transporter n=1 Tax=Diaporthe ampelina TaxID=1214573 RepID=A0A0G2HS65_9PEZI|nr:putative mfs transporter [Diaporthe ampelina]
MSFRQIREPVGSTSTPVADAKRGGSSSGRAAGSTLAEHEQEQNSTAAEPPQPWLKIFSVGFAFFCAGINDSTLGPLIPYLLVSFSIGTGMVAILSLRPWAWSGLPAFAVSFFLQSLGTAYQDALGNTFVSGVRVAHRWLGCIHAMYALALLVGPLVATAVASSASPGNGGGFVGGEESWKRTYFVTLGLGVVNLVWVMVAFRDTLAVGEEQHGQTALSALRDMGTMLKVKDVWLISLFFFFALGTAQTTGGWVVAYLVELRGGDVAKVGYVPSGQAAGMLLGRLLLLEPTHRFGEKPMLLLYFIISIGLQLVSWLVPNIIAGATALSIMGFFQGPFFATGVSVASKIFPRKIQERRE